MILLALFLFLFVFCGAASAATTELVSVNSQQELANGGSSYPSISSDGRYVAFASDASNLVLNDNNGVTDIFLRDTQTNATSRVSLASDGSQANGASDFPSISANGRFVTFMSVASNLVSADTNTAWDIFLHDMTTGTTTLVGFATNGGNNWQYRPSISADGNYITYASDANNLVTNDNNGLTDIFLYNTQTKTTNIVSIATDGTQANDRSMVPGINANGRYITFNSWANNLVTGDSNGALDVYVHDMITGTTTRVSVATGGIQANSLSSTGVLPISADGRFITFDSAANNLALGDSNGNWDVFLHDMLTGTTTQVSVSSGGTGGNSYSGIPSISSDGRFITFDSWSTNLVSGDNNGLLHVFVRDMVTATTTRVSVDKDGTQANGDCYVWSVSGNGYRIVFYSTASNLVAMDNNQVSDIFLRDLNAWDIYPGDSIQETIDSLAPGGEVNIHAGTYTENIVINIPEVTLKSAGDGTVTIQGADNSKPVISILSDATRSVIQGLNIVGGLDGIFLDNVNNVQITDNTVTNNIYYGININNGVGNTINSNTVTRNNDTGIQLNNGSNDNNVSANTITDNRGIGIGIRSESDDNTVSGNTVYNNFFGIWDYGYGHRNTITDNTITNNIWDGIRLWHAYNDTVSGNILTKNGEGIQIRNANDNTVTGNIITNSENYGVTIRFASAGNVISGNTIKGSIYYGIMIHYSEARGNVISGNTITGTVFYDGILLTDGTSDNIVLDNTITNNKGDGIKINNNSSANTISGNTITSNSQNGISIETSSYNQIINGNNITGNGYNGISITNSSGNLVNNNVISDNGNEINEFTQKNGIYLLNSGLGTEISENTINNNTYDGILLQGSSVAEIHFNRIVFNQNYGLENQGTGIINAQNNWWGSNNNPIDKSQPQIINSETGKVNADTWLILSLSPKKQTISTIETAIITADLTINNIGENTLSTYSKHVPDGTFVYFTTNMGQISLISSTTSEGQATTNFSSSNTGTATIVVTLDKQSMDTTVKIKKK